MAILVVGTNYASSPIELRERLAFRPEQIAAALAALRQEAGLEEAAILSTCNRTEVYAASSDAEPAWQRVAGFLSRHSGCDAQRLEPHLYRLAEPDSVRHLFRVASGLDSMVLGEAEILHQVKRAYELALDAGASGKALNALFQRALNAGKAVRSKTALGEVRVSIGTVALELAQKIFGSLRARPVLLLGAGKIGEITLQRLAERGASAVTILNRSVDRAALLAGRHGARSGGLSELADALLRADIVLCSTAAPEPLIRREDVLTLMARRRHRPLCMIDLGVPRNIDPAAGGVENVYLFNIDDLQGLLNHNHEQRLRAVAQSQRIIDDKVGHFLARQQRDPAGCVNGSSSARAAAP